MAKGDLSQKLQQLSHVAVVQAASFLNQVFRVMIWDLTHRKDFPLSYELIGEIPQA